MSEPTIILGMPDEDYRAEVGVSNSALKYMQVNPAEYLHQKNARRETTAAQLFGQVLHAALLEPHRKLHCVKPDGMSFVTKEGKAWRDAQTLPILSQAEDNDVSGAYAAIMAHPVAGSIVQAAQKEVSCFKRDEKTGLALKCRADLVYSNDSGLTIIADIKTTDDASEYKFRGSAIGWDYPRQAAYYLDLFGASKFLFIAVEKSAPYGVQIFEVSDDKLASARDRIRENLDTLKTCIDSDNWPTYSTSIKLI